MVNGLEGNCPVFKSKKGAKSMQTKTYARGLEKIKREIEEKKLNILEENK